jgi:hypothetical protein
MQESKQKPIGAELIKQLIGEWTVGVAMKINEDQIVSGCGEMSAVEIGSGINSELNMHLEGYDDYYENDLWSFDEETGEVHLFGITSEGDAHDHAGTWKADGTLELNWRGTFEDQEDTEQINVRWLNPDQFEVQEVASKLGKIALTTNYVFKRK